MMWRTRHIYLGIYKVPQLLKKDFSKTFLTWKSFDKWAASSTVKDRVGYDLYFRIYLVNVFVVGIAAVACYF